MRTPALTITELPDAKQLAVTARASSATATDWPWTFQRPALACQLQIDDASTRCSGTVSAKDHAAATFSVTDGAGGISLKLKSGAARVSVDSGGTPAGSTKFGLVDVPLKWLQPLLTESWSAATLTSGTLSGDLSYKDGSEPTLAGRLETRDFGMDTRDGLIAAGGLALSGQIEMTFAPLKTGISWRGKAVGGEWLFDPLYVAMPEQPVDLDIRTVVGESGWQIERLTWSDPGVLQLSATGRVNPAEENWLPALALEVSSDRLAEATPRYLDSLLAMAGLAGLRIEGGVVASIAIEDGYPSRLDASLDNFTTREANQRFDLDSLTGQLHWRRHGDAEDSALTLKAAAVHGIVLGAAELALGSTDGGLRLRQPSRLPLLGGQLLMNSMQWRPAFVTGGSPSFELGIALDSLDMDQMSTVLGWPQFGGSVSGRMPSASYADGVMQFSGGMDLNVFDGTIRIDGLSMERPFGVAPTLAADIRLDGLDLVKLTHSFGFGEISGRLEGRIDGLRLVNWSPVAFDADLRTSTSAKDRRRISQRAVNDLSSVGGSGIAGGIQAQVLRVFDTFGYAQIGLRCRLDNNVCHMDGLDSSAGGYTIVQGSGLPRVSVIGHQRQVDWPVLLARLQAATEGQMPEVR